MSDPWLVPITDLVEAGLTVDKDWLKRHERGIAKTRRALAKGSNR
jgi:hypothetical protein